MIEPRKNKKTTFFLEETLENMVLFAGGDDRSKYLDFGVNLAPRKLSLCPVTSDKRHQGRQVLVQNSASAPLDELAFASSGALRVKKNNKQTNEREISWHLNECFVDF